MNIVRNARRLLRFVLEQILPRPSRIAVLGIEKSGKTALLKALNGRKFAHPRDDEAADRIESGVEDQGVLSCQYCVKGRHGFYDFIVEDYKGVHFGSTQFIPRIVEGSDGAVVIVRNSLSQSGDESAKSSKRRYLDVCARLGNMRAVAILDAISASETTPLRNADASRDFLSEIRDTIIDSGVPAESVKMFRFTATPNDATQKKKREAEQEASKPFLWLSEQLTKSIWNRWLTWMVLVVALIALVLGAIVAIRNYGGKPDSSDSGSSQDSSEDGGQVSPEQLPPTKPSNQEKMEKLARGVKERIDGWKSDSGMTTASLISEYLNLAREYGQAANFFEATEYVAGRLGPELVDQAQKLEKSLASEHPSGKVADEARMSYDNLVNLCDMLCGRRGNLIKATPLGGRWEVKFAEWFKQFAYDGNSKRTIEEFRYEIAIEKAKLVVVNSEDEYRVALNVDTSHKWNPQKGTMVADKDASDVWIIPRPTNFDGKGKMHEANAMQKPPIIIQIGGKGIVRFHQFDTPQISLFVCRKGEKSKHLEKSVEAIRLCGAIRFFTDFDNKGIACRKLSYVIERKTGAEVQCWLYGRENPFCPLQKLRELKASAKEKGSGR